MTSEGQHAGQQPAGATSAGDGFPPDEFPPDQSDAPASPQTAWGPDAYPNSYGPPPYPQPGAGSPFVVPAVPVFSPSTTDGPATTNGADSAAGSPASSAFPRGAGPAGATTPSFGPPSGFGPASPSSGFGPAPTADQAASNPAPPAQPPPKPTSGFGGQNGTTQPRPEVGSESPEQASAPVQPSFGPSPTSGSAAVPGAARATGSASVSGSASVPGSFNDPAPSSAWAPATPAGYGDERDPFARRVQASSSQPPSPGGPLPVAPRQVPSGQVPSGQVPSGQLPSGQLPSGQVPSGQVPAGQDSAGAGGPIEPHPYRDSPDAVPYRDDAEPHPYRNTAGTPPPPAPGPPQPAPAPPLPPLPTGGFNGFGAANPNASGHGSGGPQSASPAPGSREWGSQSFGSREPGSTTGSRPPGISAFGDQRVRVPGATLAGLPDAPPETFPADPHAAGGPFGAPATDSPPPTPAPARHTSNGLPVRGTGAQTLRPGEPGYPNVGSQPHGTVPPSFPSMRGGPVQGGTGFAPAPAPTDTNGGLPARRPDAAAAAQAVAAESPAVPQPRTPLEPPAAGTARPVSASASVPTASRIAPPVGPDEVPPPGAPAKARVYGRAAPAEPGVSPIAQAIQTTPPPPMPTFGGAEQPGSFGDLHERPQPESRPFEARPAESRSVESRPHPSWGAATATPPETGAPDAGFAAPEQRTGSPQSPAGPYVPPGSVRASGNARVSPPLNGHPFASPAAPPPQGPEGVPFSEHTTDLAGRGRGPAAPFSEHTTDLAGRDRSADQPYVPAPALPTLHPSAPPADARTSGFAGPPGRTAMGDAAVGGAFGGPANRATVTPPDPAETSSWPAPAAQPDEQGRFDAFKPEGDDAAPAEKAPEVTPHVRKLPVLIGVLLVSALLVGGALGIVWLLARPSGDAFAVEVGGCVKKDGEKAVTATCATPGSFQVVSKVDAKEQCADPTQPYVLVPAGDGRNRVLCLKASG